MKLDEAREAFEHWYTKGNKDCPSIQRTENRGKGELPYRLMQAQHAWTAWQAAWEALQPKAVDVEFQEDYENLCLMICGARHMSEQEALDAVQNIYEKGLLGVPDGYVLVPIGEVTDWIRKLEGACMMTNRQHERVFGSDHALNTASKTMLTLSKELKAMIQAAKPPQEGE